MSCIHVLHAELKWKPGGPGSGWPDDFMKKRPKCSVKTRKKLVNKKYRNLDYVIMIFSKSGHSKQ
jgi:hypothetical protein